MDDFTKNKLKEMRYNMLQAQKLHMEGDKIMGKVWEELNKLCKDG